MARDIRPHGNLVGSQIRRLRTGQGLSQPALAAKCQRLGWDVGRDIIARIEARIRLVTDSELVFLARSLGVPLVSLFPHDVAKQVSGAKR
ncbi:MAG: helix-turn-helix transcriptional regulator [Verrucomicrobiae bacterium]